MDTDRILREHLVWLLDSGDAHAGFDRVTDGVPVALRGTVPERFPYSLWSLVEHLRICQWDILEFSRNPNHVSPDFPTGYWPASPVPADEAAWDDTRRRFRDDLGAMKSLVLDPATDLMEPIPHGAGQTVLREALLVADHNSYHYGQMIAVRRVLGIWDD